MIYHLPTTLQKRLNALIFLKLITLSVIRTRFMLEKHHCIVEAIVEAGIAWGESSLKKVKKLGHLFPILSPSQIRLLFAKEAERFRQSGNNQFQLPRIMKRTPFTSFWGKRTLNDVV